MSWYGSHIDNQYTKTYVKTLLPPGACKLCIYRVRFYLTECHGSCSWKEIECTRCGLKIDPTALARRLGLRI